MISSCARKVPAGMYTTGHAAKAVGCRQSIVYRIHTSGALPASTEGKGRGNHTYLTWTQFFAAAVGAAYLKAGIAHAHSYGVVHLLAHTSKKDLITILKSDKHHPVPSIHLEPNNVWFLGTYIATPPSLIDTPFENLDLRKLYEKWKDAK